MKLHFLPRYSFFRNLPCSTANHLMVESDRISVTLITCGIARTIALDILNGYMIGHTTGRPYKTKFYCVYGKMFFIIESLFNSKRGWDASKCKSSSKCASNSNTSELFVSPSFFFFYVNFVPDDVYCKMIRDKMTLLSTQYVTKHLNCCDKLR